MPKTKLFRVAIAVPDLDEAINRYATLTGANFTRIEDVIQQEIG